MEFDWPEQEDASKPASEAAPQPITTSQATLTPPLQQEPKVAVTQMLDIDEEGICEPPELAPAPVAHDLPPKPPGMWPLTKQEAAMMQKQKKQRLMQSVQPVQTPRTPQPVQTPRTPPPEVFDEKAKVN